MKAFCFCYIVPHLFGHRKTYLLLYWHLMSHDQLGNPCFQWDWVLYLFSHHQSSPHIFLLFTSDIHQHSLGTLFCLLCSAILSSKQSLDFVFPIVYNDNTESRLINLLCTYQIFVFAYWHSLSPPCIQSSLPRTAETPLFQIALITFAMFAM